MIDIQIQCNSRAIGYCKRSADDNSSNKLTAYICVYVQALEICKFMSLLIMKKKLFEECYQIISILLLIAHYIRKVWCFFFAYSAVFNMQIDIIDAKNWNKIESGDYSKHYLQKKNPIWQPFLVWLSFSSKNLLLGR